MTEKHVLSILVENKPGVLTRITALFARRSYNIVSLAVGETEQPETSRVTIAIVGDENEIDQIVKQTNKLINVLHIEELSKVPSVQRRLMLIKVNADESRRTGVLQVVELFRAHVVDVSAESVVIESIGNEEKLNALVAALTPYGVKEIVQSGSVAISRGPKTIRNEK
ncbi:acetolactate synthase small subunit [Gleimia sp. 6138-11-ORH1]|uniref:acetolactate synthase small subunit n=1 Tax=Gleimia sp. 6138-11-ORH1 TaxID=2973937 RepID=UPI002168BA41|nr:acetolactate synthase small subunit [Gleimia sp. 6138-11-ORH1]MCS4484851.1 acetolactate synthase small subunit [Gleimia sp. 6138-11-ORH1]